ncbi:hypothetical protein KKF34_05900 [Myxococcota bacterium]|nr:hypothetical protein [Myxococcota bacterium]MBU1382279.1 hypothetical protein [Myxococcota bacterium]MBU1496394.1 hypothetical protein [Myxococcota bacterium]
MRKVYLILISTMILASCGGKKKPEKGAESEIKSSVTIKDGNAFYKEKILLSGVKKTFLTRNIYLNNLNMLARQRVSDVSLTDSKGTKLRFRIRNYNEWANIDILELPSDNIINLSFTVVGGAPLSASLMHRITGIAWNLPVKNLDFEMIFPFSIKGTKFKFRNNFSDIDKPDYKVKDNILTFNIKNLKKGSTVDMTGTLENWSSSQKYKKGVSEIVKQNLIALIFIGIFLIFSISAFFLSPLAAVKLTVVMNSLITVMLVIILFPSVRYWYFESIARGGDFSNTFSEIFMSMSFMSIFLFILFKVNQGLLAFKKSAWYMQIGLGAFLFIVTPMPHTSTILLPVLGFGQLIYWLRKDIAFQFGIGLYSVSEYVQNEGEVTFDNAAKKFKLSSEQFTKLLEHTRNLPIVTDYSHKLLMSPENAALKENLRCCPYCSGASMMLTGAAKAECEYCGREFVAPTNMKKNEATVKKGKNDKDNKTSEEVTTTGKEKPVPVIVDAVAEFFRSFAFAAGGFGVLIGFVFFVMGVFDGDGMVSAIAVALFGAAVLMIPAYLIYALSEGLRKGKYYWEMRIFLIITAPLVIPLIAFFRTGTNRIKLHFGQISPQEFEKEVETKGEMSLSEVASWLDASEEEASDTVAYLAGNNIIDAVYDRRKNRLVHRKLYRSICTATECPMCGGIFGVIDGKTTCQYCGFCPAENEN